MEVTRASPCSHGVTVAIGALSLAHAIPPTPTVQPTPSPVPFVLAEPLAPEIHQAMTDRQSECCIVHAVGRFGGEDSEVIAAVRSSECSQQSATEWSRVSVQ